MYCVHSGQFLSDDLHIRSYRRVSFNVKEKEVGRERNKNITVKKEGIGTNTGERRGGDKSMWQKE
jgi:hypothetical protein